MASSAELTTDPRTGLEIVDVPPEHGKYFSELKGAVIHWFGVVDKYNSKWRTEPRIAILTDQCVYLCRPDGGITRCLNVRYIQRVVMSEQTAIGFQVGPPERDLLVAFKTPQEREMVARILRATYQATVGYDLAELRLTDESGENIHSLLQLAKPAAWTLKVEPIRSTKALTRMMLDKQRREEEERREVEAEYRRLEEGLKQELQQYRTEEYDRLVQQLAEHARLLERKQQEVQHLRDTFVSLEDKEVWRSCPNCADLRRALQQSGNDDKQKILRLERQVESQRHIVEHLQAAIQFRTAEAAAHGEMSPERAEAARRVNEQARAEIAAAQRKNRELQQLILEAPHLPRDVKARAARLAEGGDASGGFAGANSVAVRDGLNAMIAEREREIRHLKDVLSDATARQAQEVVAICAQLRRYDTQVIGFLERVFAQNIGPLAGTVSARALAEAASATALQAAGERSGGSIHGQPPGSRTLRLEGGGSMILPRGFTTVGSAASGHTDSRHGSAAVTSGAASPARRESVASMLPSTSPLAQGGFRTGAR
jgi:hypothetical protein